VQPGGINALPTAVIHGQRAKDHPKPLPRPARRAQTQQKAKLVVSSIRLEEKLEEYQRFGENPEEQILSGFTSP